MNRICVLVPLLGLAAFATYYRNWGDTPPRSPPSAHEESPAGDGYELRDGEFEAQSDLEEGKLALLSFDRQLGWEPELREVMFRRFGVGIRHLPGEETDLARRRYAHAYNDVMRAEIVARYGADIFERAAEEAVARIKAKPLH
jgi:hypothetical protein